MLSRLPFIQALTASLILIGFSISPVQSAITLYQEDFGTAASGNLSAATWLGYRDTDAKTLDNTSGTADLYYRGAFLNSPGNWNTAGSYAFVQSHGTTGAASTAMTYFTYDANAFPSFNGSSYTNLTASWSNYGNGNHRLALQVGGIWYVSSAVVSGGVGAGSGAPAGSTYVTTSTLDLGSASWLMLNLTPGSALNISGNPAITSTALFALGSVNSIGFYVSLGTTTGFQTCRYDTIAITGDLVPEPSRAILLGLAGIGLLLRRQRKFRAI